MFDPIINGKVNKLLAAGGYMEEYSRKALGGSKNLTFTATDETGGIPICQFENLLGGKTCLRLAVTWDGKKYTCPVEHYDGQIHAGNQSFLEEGDDTGEPFLILSDYVNYQILIIAKEAGEHSVEIVEFNTTIVPIDQKYLPGVCLPVVEFTNTFEMGATLTDVETNALTDAFNKGLPIVGKFSIASGSISTLFTLCNTEDVGYVAITLYGSFVLAYDGESWMVIVQ